MSKRINIMLPEKTLAVLDRVAPRGNRSSFVSKAVLHYVETHGRQSLREQLKAGYLANAGENLKIAATREFLEVILAIGNVAEKRLDGVPVPSHIATRNDRPSATGPPLADQHPQRAALAGSIGTKQTEQLAGLELQVQLVHRGERAVAHTKSVQAKDRRGVHLRSRSARFRRIMHECLRWWEARVVPLLGKHSIVHPDSMTRPIFATFALRFCALA